MKTALAWLWPLVPSISLSGLIHATDDEIGGIGGLVASPGVVLSVLVWSVPAAICVWLLLAVRLRFGLRWTLAGAVPLSTATGVVIAILGSTADGPLLFAWSVVGSGVAVLAFFLLALLPAAAWLEHLRVSENPSRNGRFRPHTTNR